MCFEQHFTEIIPNTGRPEPIVTSVHDHTLVPRLPWLARCGRWNFLRDTGGVYRIHTWSSLFVYEFICIWDVKPTLIHSSKQKSYYSNIYPTRCNVTQFILSGNCSTCFGWYHHPSSRAKTTVSTASHICHTVTAICHPQHSQTMIAAGSSNGVTNTRCCRYSWLRSWWWVEVPPETCRAVSR
jgi:hypothetical protein